MKKREGRVNMEAVLNKAGTPSQTDSISIFKLYLWVLSYLAPYKTLFSLLIVCNLSISLIEMLIPRFIQYFIDVILPNNKVILFYSLLGAIAIVLGLMFVFTVIRNHLQRDIQEKAARDLQFDVFRKLRLLGFAYYEKHPVGETLSLLNNDVSAVQQIYQSYLPRLIQHILFVSVMTVVMFLMQWNLFMAVVPCFFTFYFFAPYLSRKTTLYGRQRAEDGKTMNKRMYDSLMALPEIQASGSENWDKTRLLSTVDTFNQSDLKTTFFALLRGSLRNLSISLGAIVLFIYGSYLIRTGAITVGEFVAFIFYYFMAIGMFSFIIMSIAAQKAILFQAEKIHNFMMQAPKVIEPLNPVALPKVKGEIIFRNVSFGYPRRPEVLSGFNLHIHSGDKVALVGASGNGKSTILKLIGRFYDPSEGEICLDDIPLQKLSFYELRDAIGVVFQETYLFNNTVKENIRFGRPEASDEEVKQAAIAAYAHDFIIQLPEGYNTVVNERGDKLSGGQKQRIAIARTIIKNPAVVLLDEATSALDPISEKEVGFALDALFKGRTIVTVAHRLSTIRHYNTIMFIAEGRVIESGTYNELMSRKQHFYHFVTGGADDENQL